MENRDSKACASEQGRKPTAPMLINHISRMFDERMRAILPAGHPMTQNSCRFIMGNLMHHDGMTQQELVNNTNMKAPTISIAILRLAPVPAVTGAGSGGSAQCSRLSDRSGACTG